MATRGLIMHGERMDVHGKCTGCTLIVLLRLNTFVFLLSDSIHRLINRANQLSIGISCQLIIFAVIN